MKKFLQRFPFSPLAIALITLLALWVVNYDQTPFYSIWRTGFFTIIFTVILVILFRLVFGSWTKAGLVTDIFLVLFFTYGHLYNLVKAGQITFLAHYRVLLTLFLVLLAAGIFGVIKLGKRRVVVYRWTNILTGVLLAIVLGQTGIRLVEMGALVKKAQPHTTSTQFASAVVDAPIGDVYYILMDSYGRQDFLQQYFDFDNSEFIQALKDRGFIIPDCSQSNYDTTTYSLASSLNMKYIDDLGVVVDQPVKDDESWDFYVPIHQSLVRQKFQEYGYQFVTFKTLYPFLDISDSNLYYDVDEHQPFYAKVESLNFQHLFFSTTMLRPLIGIQKPVNTRFDFILSPIIGLINPQPDIDKSRESRLYEQYQFALEKLNALPNLPGRKFVYAHLFLTHSPFIYNQDGSLRSSFEDSSQAYRDQIVHANSELLKIIDRIILRSDKPPVIILQGDHTYRVMGEDRVKILNAYYLPGDAKSLVTPDITPVNTFRIVFDAYFGEELPLLPNHSYYRELSGTTVLRETPDSCIQ